MSGLVCLCTSVVRQARDFYGGAGTCRWVGGSCIAGHAIRPFPSASRVLGWAGLGWARSDSLPRTSSGSPTLMNLAMMVRMLVMKGFGFEENPSRDKNQTRPISLSGPRPEMTVIHGKSREQ